MLLINIFIIFNIFLNSFVLFPFNLFLTLWLKYNCTIIFIPFLSPVTLKISLKPHFFSSWYFLYLIIIITYMHIACIVFMCMHKYIQRQLTVSVFIVGMTMVSSLTPSPYVANHSWDRLMFFLHIACGFFFFCLEALETVLYLQTCLYNTFCNHFQNKRKHIVFPIGYLSI